MSRNKGRSSFHLKVYLKLVSGFNLDTCDIHFPWRVQTLLKSELDTNVYFCTPSIVSRDQHSPTHWTRAA